MDRFLQGYAPAFFGGAGSRFEDADHDEVIGQGGEVVAGIGLSAEHVGQVGNIVLVEGGMDADAVVGIFCALEEGPVI